MKIKVSLPKDETFDWNAPCYALVSVGMYKCKVWGVGTSVEDLKRRVRESIISKNLSKDYEERLLRNIKDIEYGQTIPQINHNFTSFKIYKCDLNLFLYYNQGLCGRESFIFDEVDGQEVIRYAR